MSLSSLLLNRELGTSITPSQMQGALDQRIAAHWVSGRCHSGTIALPADSQNTVYRAGNFAAVISRNGRVERCALYSLSEKRKLWDVVTHDDLEPWQSGYCELSSGGLVLTRDIILYDGKQTGSCTRRLWREIHLVGLKIIGKSTGFLLEERNHEGENLGYYQLDSARGKSDTPLACDKNFCVHFSGSLEQDLPSIIEILDRKTGKMTTVKLPVSCHLDFFSTPYIFKNLLVFGKSFLVSKNFHEPSQFMCVFDLVEMKMIHEIDIGESVYNPEHIVANERFIAWHDNGSAQTVKLLNLENKTLKTLSHISDHNFPTKVSLNIAGNILSIIHPLEYASPGYGLWIRKAIDMTTGELKAEKIYKYYSRLSMDNGILLSTHDSRLYIENFQ